jgi:hypothetical protein
MSFTSQCHHRFLRQLELLKHRLHVVSHGFDQGALTSLTRPIHAAIDPLHLESNKTRIQMLEERPLNLELKLENGLRLTDVENRTES